MRTARIATIELLAPIEFVWEALATTGWTSDPAEVIEVVAGRAPDLVTWHVTGAVVGTVEWDLDDLDGVTAARATWRVGPAHPRAQRRERERTAQRRHDERVIAVADRLAEVVAADVVLIRTRSGQHHVERAPRGAGTALLAAMWLTAPRS